MSLRTQIMLAEEISAAQRLLHVLARITGTFQALPSPGGPVTSTIDRVLRRRPRSLGRLHWSSDSGRYREVWVSRRGQALRLFHLYFGSWGRTARLSAYVVLFRRGNPRLEVRLSPASPSPTGKEPIRHRLVFFGKTYKTPERLRKRALTMARRAGIPVNDRQAILGDFDAKSGVLRPGPREVLRRILICGLIKQSLIEAAQTGNETPAAWKRTSKTSSPKRERFPKGKHAKIDLLLDKRFEAWGRHNQLQNRLRETLEAKGYRAEPRGQYDLVVSRGQQRVIIEVKGWSPSNLMAALRAATGQLLYYGHLFRQQEHRTPSLVAAITCQPTADLTDFVEKTAEIGLVWRRADGQLAAGALARRILPKLVE